MNLRQKKKLPKSESLKNRRKFLKKAAYAAPTIVALTYISSPTSAFAESSASGTPWDTAPQP